MSTQLFRTGTEMRAWVGLLRAHSAVTRELSAELVALHGLTLNDYEVLLFLARAPQRRLRRVDLANSVLLTASGITRLLEGLERAGFVTRESCDVDARVVYARMTDAGYEKLREASTTHVAGIKRVFRKRFSEAELGTLASLLARLPGAEGDAECSAPT